MLFENILIEPLKEAALNSPDRIVLEFGRKSLCAFKLYNNSKTLAFNLSEAGLKEGELVLLAVFPDQEFLTIFYALLMLRCKIAIIDNEMGEDNYEAKMKQLQPKWLFADSRLLLINKYPFLKKIANRFRKNLPKLYLNESLKIISAGIELPFTRNKNKLKSFLKPTSKEIKLETNNTVYENLIIYTSGTLSMPKGVVHTNLSLHTTLKNLAKVFEKDKNVVLASYLPHFILLGIACNFSVKVIDPLLNPKRKLNWFYTEKITVYFGAPYDYLALIEYCEKNKIKFPICLQHLIVGSAPVHKQFLKRLINVLPAHIKITCTYGMTEHLITSLVDGREKLNYECNGDFLGNISDDVEVKINTDSEILVKSNQLFKRYLGHDEVVDFHPTGDLGFIDINGNLILTGRKKDMIIRRDFNLYPALYEDTVRKIPGISEAAFIGVYDEKSFDEKVYLVIEASTITEADVMKKLKAGPYSIGFDALPDKIIKMQMPRLGRHHKIDKIKIAEIIKTIAL